MESNVQDSRRPSLSDRLNSLLPGSSQRKPTDSTHSFSEPPSRRSADAPRSDHNMRSVRTRPPSPRASTVYGNRSSHTRSAQSLSLQMSSAASSSKSTTHQREQSQPILPILRWFSGSAKQHAKKPSITTTQSRPDTPLQYSDSPVDDSPNSSVSALAEALHDDPRLIEAHTPHLDLPSRPQAARLPPPLRPWKPPSHLSDLARSALPTASLSPTSPFYKPTYTDPFEDPYTPNHNPDLDMFFSPTPTPIPIPHSPAQAHLSRSPPSLSPSSTRSSIDTLRSIQEKGRAIHTTPPVQKLSLPTFNPFGWFSSEDEAQQKENMDPLLDERDKAQDPATQKETIKSHYASPNNPVVFCHGLLGFDTVTLGPAIAPLQVTHWRGIKDALESNGTEVLITRVPATSSPIDRARVLEEKISEAYPGRMVHLIERSVQVLSITTISSPHRGSSFADHFLATVGIERMPSVLSLLDLLPNGGGDGKAFEFLTVENMRKFNEDVPDVPGVKYFSWGATYEPGLIDTWKWPHSVILEKEGPNDGLVSLKSAQWGTYLGTLEGVNHLDLVGWVNTARYKWAQIMGREIKFKPGTFYLGIADHLARVVEGQEQPDSAGDASVSKADREEREEIRQEGERVEMAESLERVSSDAKIPTASGVGSGTPRPQDS